MKVKRASKGVSPWKEGSVFVTDIDLESRLNTQNVGERVPIAEHNALWVSSCTRGVDQRVESKWVVGHIECVFGFATKGHEFSPSMNSDTFWRQLVCRFFTHQENTSTWPATCFLWHVFDKLVQNAGVCHSEKGWG